MREGSTFKRCGGCTKRAANGDRRCTHCAADKLSWYFTVDLAPTGAPRKQRTKGGFATKAAALEAMNDLQQEAAKGKLVEASKLTVEGYLIDRWLPSYGRRVRPGTFTAAEGHIRVYIVPTLGAVPLQALDRSMVKAFYDRLANTPRERGEGPLSPKSIANVHITLRRALHEAVEDKLLFANPADGAFRMSRDKPQMKVWDEGQVSNFLRFVGAADKRTGTPVERYTASLWPALYQLAFASGARRGELLGVLDDDIGLDTKTWNVQRGLQRMSEAEAAALLRTHGNRLPKHIVALGGNYFLLPPKTRRSRRALKLEGDTVGLLRALRRTRAEARMQMGPDWQENGLIFCRPDGSPLDPDAVSQHFDRQVAAFRKDNPSVPVITFHGARHSHASILFRKAVDAGVVSRRLGHASVGFTLDTYVHALPGQDEAAADVIARVLSGAGA